MNQRTTLEIIAPTVEEAIAQGLAQLGLTADAVTIEVLDAGNKGLFGLGKPQVRVRLTVNQPVDEIEESRTESAVPEKEAKLAPRTQVQPAPVKVAESSPEHDPLLDHTEAVVSK